MVNGPWGRAWFFGFPFKGKCRIIQPISVLLLVSVLLLMYEWAPLQCREDWQREAEMDAFSDVASAESGWCLYVHAMCSLQGFTPAGQEPSKAVLPLLFSPLHFFCLNAFELDKTLLNVHNTSASAQIHGRILSFCNSFCMI